MLDRTFDVCAVFEAIDGEPSAFCKVAVLLLYRLDLYRVERYECCLTSALIAKKVDTFNGNLFVLHNNGVQVAAEHGRHSSFVLFRRGLTQVDYPTSDTGENSLQTGEGLLKLGFTFILSLVRASCKQLAVYILKFLVELGFLDAAISSMAAFPLLT